MSNNRDDLGRLEELFHRALEHAPSERSAFVQRASGGNAKLERRLLEMLHAEERDPQTLASPGGDELANSTEAAIQEGPGSVIGRYKLLERLGEGGFGVVYMAEQTEPVMRRVALKIIKLGMDTKEVVARFEAERQALALMDHPHIARVLDGGATSTGRPYFVMELVRGVSITEYCDEARALPRERLELLRDVSRAVQHAHQKGVIHRDIKPSNVLVTLHDGRPVPKVIDFGIAKAMHSRLTEKTLFTRYQQFIGTPAYMSPEQAEMSGLDIDTRSDIYSLGVLLYELLTGSTPIAADLIQRAGVAELQRVLREDEVERPSSRISTRADAGVASLRRLDVSTLAKHLRGDLDWIVLKALEKDRNRRYASAGELGEDIERHLRQEPVQAGPPSARYKLGKFIARNRALVTTGSLVLLALLLAVIGTSLGMREAANQRDLAEGKAQSYGELTDYLIDMLSLADPRLAMSPDVSVRELLELGAERAGEVFQGEPVAEARVRGAMGRAFLSLGEHKRAEEHLLRASELFESHPAADRFEYYQVLWAMTNTAFKLERHDGFTWANRARAAGHAHLHEATPQLAQLLDDFHNPIEQAGHAADLQVLQAAVDLIPTVLAEARASLPAGDRRWEIVAETFMSAGYWMWYTPNEEFGVAYFEAAYEVQSAELPAGDPNAAESLAVLCGMLSRCGRASEASSRLRDAVRDLSEVLGPDNFQRAFIESMYGESLVGEGQFEKAAEFLLPAHEVITAGVAKPSDFYLQDSFARLVALYEAWGRPGDAERVRSDLADRMIRGPFLSPWPIIRRTFGPEHNDVLAALDRCYEYMQGAVFLAEVEMRPASPVAPDLKLLLSKLVGPGAMADPHRSLVARSLQSLNRAIGLPEDQELALELALAARAALSTWRVEIPIEIAAAGARCAELEAALGRDEEALQSARDALAALNLADHERSWFAAVYQLHVARGLLAVGLFGECEGVLLSAREVLDEQLGVDHPQTLSADRMLVDLYEAWRRPADAARYRPR